MQVYKVDFLKKIKEKYPEYNNIDDNTLYNKVIQKYPEYKQTIIEENKTQPITTPQLEATPEQIQAGAKAIETADRQALKDNYLNNIKTNLQNIENEYQIGQSLFLGETRFNPRLVEQNIEQIKDRKSTRLNSSH